MFNHLKCNTSNDLCFLSGLKSLSTIWKVLSWKVWSWKVSLKLERAKRSWKEQSEVGKNRLKLESLSWSWKARAEVGKYNWSWKVTYEVGKFKLNLERLNEVGKFQMNLERSIEVGKLNWYKGSGLKWMVLGQSGRIYGLNCTVQTTKSGRSAKVGGPEIKKWTVQKARSEWFKRIKVDGLKYWKCTVQKHRKVKSMLVTEIGDKVCWWQIWDGYDKPGHQLGWNQS